MLALEVSRRFGIRWIVACGISLTRLGGWRTFLSILWLLVHMQTDYIFLFRVE
jgi:hypothetical protein